MPKTNRQPEHIPGTHVPYAGAPAETRQQRRARLYPGPADRREGARYYVVKRKTNREYMKIWTEAERWPRGEYEAAACVIAGDPDSLGSTGISRDYLYKKCRRVTRPLEMPEPWRSLLIPLSITATEASFSDLFSENIPCPTCGFQQTCKACTERVAAATDQLARERFGEEARAS